MELLETVEVPSTLQRVGSVSADVGFRKQGEKPKSLKALKDLPKTWWREASSDRGGYQWITELTVMDRVVKTLLDTGAAINAVTEEFLVALLNCAAKRGLSPTDPTYPVLQMERWPEAEEVSGVAKEKPVQLLGAVVLQVRLGRVGTNKNIPFVPVRCKIFAAGSCDWHGLILGGRTLDLVSRGGLGLRATEDAYVLESHGVVLPRLEEGEHRPDKAYGLWPVMGVAALLSTFGGVFDSDSDGDREEPTSVGAVANCVGPLIYSGDPLVLEPDEGAWVWAECLRQERTSGPNVAVEAVMASRDSAAEVAPGLWATGAAEGLVFVGNPTNFDMALDPGSRLGVVVAGAAQTRHCWACGADDSEMIWESRAGKECGSCQAHAELVPLECRQCGAGPGNMEVRGYSGCANCQGRPTSRLEARQQASMALARPLCRKRSLRAMAPRSSSAVA
jgi:hypothetical protein